MRRKIQAVVAAMVVLGASVGFGGAPAVAFVNRRLTFPDTDYTKEVQVCRDGVRVRAAVLGTNEFAGEPNPSAYDVAADYGEKASDHVAEDPLLTPTRTIRVSYLTDPSDIAGTVTLDTTMIAVEVANNDTLLDNLRETAAPKGQAEGWWEGYAWVKEESVRYLNNATLAVGTGLYFVDLGAGTVTGGADPPEETVADCLLFGPPDPPPPPCASDDAIVGTADDDVLVGTSGADVICGLGGADVIVGRGGPDTLYGNAGADVLVGARGLDTLYGGRGKDTLVGGPGVDVLVGGPGVDTEIQ